MIASSAWRLWSWIVSARGAGAPSAMLALTVCCAGSVHPFYFATQFHPEFKSRPYRPSPPFAGLLFAATGQLDTLLERGVAPPIHDPSAHPRRDSAEMYTAAAAAAAE